MDPIATLIMLAGEDARLLSPADIAAYDPSAEEDYAPNKARGLMVKGVPETKIELFSGATGAFTFEATCKPEGLMANSTRLLWRDTMWTILLVRNRTWLGKINGFTLHLAS